MHHSVTIFSLDAQSNAMNDYFIKNWCKHVIGVVPKQAVGSYKGVQELSVLMASLDFDKYVRGTSWITNQESVLHVTGCNKAYARLEYLQTGFIEGLGSMCQVSREVALTHDSWTHRPDNNVWFVTSHSNPDHSQEITAKETA